MTPGSRAVRYNALASLLSIHNVPSVCRSCKLYLTLCVLGNHTDPNSPPIKDFVPLADLAYLVFGCWDSFEDNCYEASLQAGVIEPTRLEAVRPELEALKPWKAVFDQHYVRRLLGPHVKT